MILLVLSSLLGSTHAEPTQHQYCIVGAGPGGIQVHSRELLDSTKTPDPLLFSQLAALMHKAGRDYIVFERNAVAGSFFLQYPRHRVLNGINRVNTGSVTPAPSPRPGSPLKFMRAQDLMTLRSTCCTTGTHSFSTTLSSASANTLPNFTRRPTTLCATSLPWSRN